ncbi:MAG: hypothetical protein ACI8RZ_002169, partial [Myxococcota bacterium]
CRAPLREAEQYSLAPRDGGVGLSVPFDRTFYKHAPPRTLLLERLFMRG